MRPPMPSPTETQMTADTKAQMTADQSATIRVSISGHPRLGQSSLEYAVFTGVVAAALVAMNVYVRRAIQANLKQLEDHVNAEALR